MLGRVTCLSFAVLALLSGQAWGDNPIKPGFPYGKQKGMSAHDIRNGDYSPLMELPAQCVV